LAPYSWLPSLKISAAYLALVVGSGFATGQEAMQFFVAHGWHSFSIAFITLLLLGYTAQALMRAGRRHNLRTNESVFRYYCGQHLGTALTWYTMIMIIAVAAVMFGGVGATLSQAYGIPEEIGAAAIALLVVATLLLGLRGILGLLGFMGPILIVLTIAITGTALFQNHDHLNLGISRADTTTVLTATPYCFFSGFLYVGLTLPGMASFLPQVGATINNDRAIGLVAIVGPTTAMLTMLLVSASLLANFDLVNKEQVPIMALASSVMPTYGSIFAVVIVSGIFTTVTPLLWSVCSRFSDEAEPAYRFIVVSLTSIALLGATVLPFGELLNLIYPSIGYVGLSILACMILTDVRALVAR